MPRPAQPFRPELADARQQGLHNIGEAATLSGVSTKMIRHYESIGLLATVGRTFAGYRIYTDNDLHRLRFIKRARLLGFPIKQIERLLGLWDNRARASAEVKKLAQAHADDLAEKIQEMQAMQQSLLDLAHRCHGDDRPECPILEDLAMPTADSPSTVPNVPVKTMDKGQRARRPER